MTQSDRDTQTSRPTGPLRTVFCGTPEFAVPALSELINSPYRPQIVLTQPDRPRGRGQRLVPSPVKEAALQAQIEVYQPEKLNSEESLRKLAATGAELAVVVAYSAKIGKKALSLFPKGWLNLHPSLLPAYRGAAPIQWALIHGEEETGITTFFLNEEWDAGPICLQKRLAILPDDDSASLSERCAKEGAKLVLESIQAIEKGSFTPCPQNDEIATFAPLLKPEHSLIDWNSAAIDIHNRVRGLSPRPGAFTEFSGKRLHILKTESLPSKEEQADFPPGQVVRADREGFWVQTGHGALGLLLLKPENRASLRGTDFINGYRVKVGDRFG